MAEELPPLTVEDLIDALANPNFKAYVYIGSADDDAWQLAISAQKMLAAVRVYLVTEPLEAAVRKKFKIAPSFAGIVFGWELDIKKKLTQDEADDFLTLTQAIADA
jgi:hypothetical protein